MDIKRRILLLGITALAICSCSKEEPVKTTTYYKYADPKGTFIINGGARMIENGSLTYIHPDGTVETDIYKKANNSELGNDARDLYIYNGKIYIICADEIGLDGKEGDGSLIIADASTMKKEKAYKLENLKFPKPEGMREEFEPKLRSLSNIAVLDERNIFIRDSHALFRFDSTTEELTLVEGSYHIANQGGSIEPLVSSKGMIVSNGKLYIGVGGFWTDDGVFEFVKDKNEVNRKLMFETGNLISGITQGKDGKFWVATYDRSNEKNSLLYLIDSNSFQIVDEWNIKDNISPGFEYTSGITAAGNNIYYSGQTTEIGRFSAETGFDDKIIDIKADCPQATRIDCNVVVNPTNNYLYIATSETASEMNRSNTNLLIYDCSKEEPVLVNNIANQTSCVANIRFGSEFY